MEKKIEQVKKVLTSSKVSVLVSVINCDNGQMKQAEDSFFGIIKNNDAEKLAAEIDALYSDPPSPEMVCPKANECNHTDCTDRLPHKLNEYCDHTLPESIWHCPACIPVPPPEPPEKVRETDKLLLTDEDLNQAWWDCYGEELPAIHGLVFGRTVRSRQILKLQLAGWGNLKEAQAENAKLKREIDSLIHDSD